MDEIWQDIEGYEGLYQVSNLGEVRSLDRIDSLGRVIKGKILNQFTNKGGYQQIQLCKDGKRKLFRVNRLVYAAFCGKIPDGMQVNHINEDKSDNRLENLNLMTSKENSNWGTRNERSAKSRINHPKRSKPVVGMDEQGNVVVTFSSTQEAERNGYYSGAVSACCRGLYGFKTHKGLIWKYKDDGDC